ncbi:hypothetical protein JKP88DRAFT_261135 [Tribonema minus]|uniref:Uncharacterized protein n=1 Tax=Tribonema minus TaxID=303371 RepID=A0A835YUH9_9STRA|nr:hypothetical protein JKP88DRAFT_261135 [Tribonema minus]
MWRIALRSGSPYWWRYRGSVQSEPPRQCALGTTFEALEVLCSAELLTRVMAYVVPGDWLYMATVSRLVQAAYTTALVQGQTRLHYMCGTHPYMAVSTPSRLGIAISCGLKEALPQCNKDTLNYAAGLSGSLAVLQRLRELGLQMTFRAVYGAAHCCDVSLLHTVYRHLALAERNADNGIIWHLIGQELALHGDAGLALTWVSQRRKNWRTGSLRSFREFAANEGHLATLQFLMGHGRILFGHAAYPSTGGTAHAAPHAQERSELTALVEEAAWGGHVHVVQWLIEEHGATPSSAVDTAVRRCHLRLLAHLVKQRGCRCDAQRLLPLAGADRVVNSPQLERLRAYIAARDTGSPGDGD